MSWINGFLMGTLFNRCIEAISEEVDEEIEEKEFTYNPVRIPRGFVKDYLSPMSKKEICDKYGITFQEMCKICYKAGVCAQDRRELGYFN